MTAARNVTATFTKPITHTITTAASPANGGSITPATQTANPRMAVNLTVTANLGYMISSVSGCNGTPVLNSTQNSVIYTTGAANANCAVTATFIQSSYTASTTTSANGGTVSPPTQQINHGSTATVTVIPNTGYMIAAVTGCSGTLSGNTYTTGAITAPCTINAVFPRACTP